jgi:hypothetical protein
MEQLGGRILYLKLNLKLRKRKIIKRMMDGALYFDNA